MRKKKMGTTVLLCMLGAIAVIATIGCENSPADNPDDAVTQSGMQLTMDIVGATDVAGMRFDIQAVPCSPGDPTPEEPPIIIVKDLEDILIPGGIEDLAGSPLDDGSAHIFADAFVVLEPGCYDVVTTPVNADGEPSADCAPANLNAVEIVSGETTEVFLINQCQSIDNGAIDVVSTLNHPPKIENLWFEKSKFVMTCEAQVVCATATDPDNDPLEWVWTVGDEPPSYGPDVVSTEVNEDGSITQCIQLMPLAAGKFNLTLTVYDLLDGDVRVEDWLAAEGYPAESHSSLAFPVYASGDIAPAEEICNDLDDDCDGETDEGCDVPAFTYTLDEDFNTGSEVNLGLDPSDQLQLINQGQACNAVWIAASARGTIVKIDTVTGDVLGEYQSSPDGRGKNPSRTTVDADCNVWATNRDEYDGGLGSVVNIGLLENGQCEDRNGNGVIDTSTGLGDIRPWTNAGLADDNGGVTTAEDECIIHYTRVAGTATRHVSLDAHNNVWVGGLGDRDFELVDNATGTPVPGTQFNLGCGGYGGVTDHNGVVWSSYNPLLRWDPATNSGECLDLVPGAYGMAIDPTTGHLWVSELGGSDSVYEIDTVTNTVLQILPQNLNGAQGVAVDSNSHVWVAQIFGSVVAHFAPDPGMPGSHIFVGLVEGFSGTTGVAVAADGKIWASEMYSSDTRGAARIDPTAGPIGNGGYPIGAIDLTVGLDAPGLPTAGPYNYSDMTGSQVTAPPNTGTWTVIYDAGVVSEFGIISWNDEPQGATPGDSQILVQVRSSDDQVTWSAAEAVSDGADVMSPDARYLEIQVQLVRATTGETPILSDLSISSTPI